jgi:hypothetical protein
MERGDRRGAVAYFVVRYEASDDGWAPAVPVATSYLALAGPVGDTHLAVIESSELSVGHGVFAVGPELSGVIDGAKSFPPAMALAREAFDAMRPAPGDESSAVEAYVDALEANLSMRGGGQWLAVTALGDETGYLIRGETYLVRPSSVEDGTIEWVSSDYFVYRNAVSDFDLPPSG